MRDERADGGKARGREGVRRQGRERAAVVPHAVAGNGIAACWCRTISASSSRILLCIDSLRNGYYDASRAAAERAPSTQPARKEKRHRQCEFFAPQPLNRDTDSASSEGGVMSALTLCRGRISRGEHGMERVNLFVYFTAQPRRDTSIIWMCPPWPTQRHYTPMTLLVQPSKPNDLHNFSLLGISLLLFLYFSILMITSVFKPLFPLNIATADIPLTKDQFSNHHPHNCIYVFLYQRDRTLRWHKIPVKRFDKKKST